MVDAAMRRSFSELDTDTRKTAMLKSTFLCLVFVIEFIIFFVVVQPRWRVSNGNQISSRDYYDITEELSSLENEVMSIAKELRHIKKQKNDLQQAKLKEDDWITAPANRLIRKSQVAGDYVHLTKDKLLCGQETLKLLIVVNTKYHEWRERDVIRNTWGKHTNLTWSDQGKHELRWRYLFVMSNFPDTYQDANLLRYEHQKRKDILDIDLFEADVFANMKFYGMLTWVINSCRFEYLLVIRPNNFLNVPVLYDFLHNGVYSQHGLYAGYLVTEKVEIPLKRKPPSFKPHHEERTLTYINKGGLLLSRDIVEKVIPDLKEMKELDYKSPEIMTGLICSKYGIAPWNIRNFFIDTNCNFERSFIMSRVENPGCLQNIYEQSQNIKRKYSVP